VVKTDDTDDFDEEFDVHLGDTDPFGGIDLDEDAQLISRQEVPDGNGPKIMLAVNDSGNWVAAVEDLVTIGVPGRGITQRIRLASVQGVLFDTLGRLWITTGDALLIFKVDSREYRRLFLHRLPGAKAPVPGRNSREILISARAGLFKATFEYSNDRPSIRLLHGMTVTACGATDSSVYVVSSGRIKEIRSETELRDRGMAPTQTQQLVVGRQDQIRIATRGNNWFAQRGGRFSPLSVSAVTVDALGRFWVGTGRGPLAPGGADNRISIAPPDTVTLQPLLLGTLASLAWDVGRPPCRKMPFQLLPQVDITANWDQKVVQYRKLDPMDDRGRLRSHFSVFAKLTWALDPFVPKACAGRTRRWRGHRMQRLKHVRDLWFARHNAVSRKHGAVELKVIIDQTVATMRYEALIQSVSGERSPKEKP
jgi:hypothetical protein